MNTPDDRTTIENLVREFASESGDSSLAPLVGALNRSDIPAAEAIRNVDRALQTFRSLGVADADAYDPRDLKMLSAMAQTYELLGGLEKASSVYEECLEKARAAGDQEETADTLWKLGRVQRKRNRWEEALDHLREAREIGEGAGDGIGVARCRIAEGNVYWELGDLETAADAFQEALERGDGDTQIAADAANNLGILATIRGDFEQAETHYAGARSAYEQLGSSGILARVLHNMGMVHLARRNWDQALDAFERSLSISLDIGNLRLSASTYVQKAAAYIELHDTSVAARYCAQALDIFREVDYPLGQAEVLKVLGRISTARGNWATSEGLLRESLRICTDYSNPLGAAETRREIGLLNQSRGRPDDARADLQQALDGFESLGAQHEAARTRELLDAVSS